METIDRNFESEKHRLSENSGASFDEKNNEEQIARIAQERHLAKEVAQNRAESLKSKLFDEADKREKVQEFIRDNCSEPIEGVDRIVPFSGLVQLLIKSAEDEKLPEVRKSIESGNARDQRIYELPAYKNLIEKGFILPSDVRTYYDSANREPVYHLGVDYNVKGGTGVKSMYDGRVVASGLDGGLGHRVIIEHEMDDGTKFYSLYGHLGPKGLPKVGDNVGKGKQIGEVGDAFTSDNGDWEEHLHFQIMKNVDSPKGYSKNEGEGNYDVLESFGKE